MDSLRNSVLVNPKPHAFRNLEDHYWEQLINTPLPKIRKLIDDRGSPQNPNRPPYPIDTNIPMPKKTQGRPFSDDDEKLFHGNTFKPPVIPKGAQYPFGSLAVGESFVAPIKIQPRVSNYRYIHAPKEFVTRKINDDWCRVWRTA